MVVWKMLSWSLLLDPGLFSPDSSRLIHFFFFTKNEKKKNRLYKLASLLLRICRLLLLAGIASERRHAVDTSFSYLLSSLVSRIIGLAIDGGVLTITIICFLPWSKLAFAWTTNASLFLFAPFSPLICQTLLVVNSILFYNFFFFYCLGERDRRKKKVSCVNCFIFTSLFLIFSTFFFFFFPFVHKYRPVDNLRIHERMESEIFF